EDESDDEVLALLSKKFQKWNKRRGRTYGKGFGSRSYGSRDKKEDQKTCYNCKKLGHFIADCPDLSAKDKGKNVSYKNRVKKSLMATWEDLDKISDREPEDEEANLALMATTPSDITTDIESDDDDGDE
ncbi:serine/threonine protein kinase SRPK1, partial [Trifolium medium]|nr:serine/threonine protein kinase SRPK1 [Trifolium medium]